jgi:hypothetical protein
MVIVVLEVVLPPRQDLHVVAREYPSAVVACDIRRRHFSVVRWHVYMKSPRLCAHALVEDCCTANENIILKHCCPKRMLFQWPKEHSTTVGIKGYMAGGRRAE